MGIAFDAEREERLALLDQILEAEVFVYPNLIRAIRNIPSAIILSRLMADHKKIKEDGVADNEEIWIRKTDRQVFCETGVPEKMVKNAIKRLERLGAVVSRNGGSTKDGKRVKEYKLNEDVVMQLIADGEPEFKHFRVIR